MSSNDNVYLSCFKWIIHPPFLPGQTMRAKFHHKSAITAKWHVILNFEKLRFGEWHVRLSLIFNKRGDAPEEIIVNNLSTRISIGEKSICDRNVPIFQFNQGNHYVYNLQTSAFMYHMMPYQMVVEIKMSLVEDLGIRPLPPHKDLKRLVRDLSNLSIAPYYHNVDIHAAGKIIYGAHSYILGTRWRNLFPWPPFPTTEKIEIRTNISSYLLRHILMYMYSGLFIRNFPHWDKPEYLTELFQVIEKYEIYHLRDNLVRSDSSQLRESKKGEISVLFAFQLLFVHHRPVNDASLSVHPLHFSTTFGNLNQFKFEIQVRKINGCGVWLSYSLSSEADCWIYAQVDFDVSKMVVEVLGGEYRKVFPRSKLAHENNYYIRPRHSVVSGPVLFLGCVETFGDLISTDYLGRVEQWLHFKISLTDGTVIDEFQSFNSSVPSVLGKYNVLVDHMSQLLEGFHSDLCLKPRSSSGDNVQDFRWVHKGIVDARIPYLYNVLDRFYLGKSLSGTERIDLSVEALPYVVEYLYTARFFNVPQHLLNEISNFAEKANLKCLNELINDIRNISGIQE